ncbi:MAG: hypothetical protein JW940_07580 [Polyangiaceae bacterium]|nr:hypothetical protein [Polyangiaceae bacterium]
MSTNQTKQSLSPPRQRLVELSQKINFGVIENLVVRDGEPLFNPPPRVVRAVKLGGENGPRPEYALRDFALRAEVRELFAHLDALGEGTVRRLEVKHGLPFRMEIEEVVA